MTETANSSVRRPCDVKCPIKKRRCPRKDNKTQNELRNRYSHGGDQVIFREAVGCARYVKVKYWLHLFLQLAPHFGVETVTLRIIYKYVQELNLTI